MDDRGPHLNPSFPVKHLPPQQPRPMVRAFASPLFHPNRDSRPWQQRALPRRPVAVDDAARHQPNRAVILHRPAKAPRRPSSPGSSLSGSTARRRPADYLISFIPTACPGPQQPGRAQPAPAASPWPAGPRTAGPSLSTLKPGHKTRSIAPEQSWPWPVIPMPQPDLVYTTNMRRFPGRARVFRAKRRGTPRPAPPERAASTATE